MNLNNVLIHFDVCVAFCADRYVFDFATAFLFQIQNVIQRFLRQVFLLAALGNVAVPALYRFENRFAIVQNVDKREFVDNLAVKLPS